MHRALYIGGVGFHRTFVAQPHQRLCRQMKHHLGPGSAHGRVHASQIADVALNMANELLDPGLAKQADVVGGKRKTSNLGAHLRQP